MLICTPYLKERVWIRQEIALHRFIVLSCGSQTIGMGHVASALNIFDQIKDLGYKPLKANGDNKSTDEFDLPWDFHPRKLVALQASTNSGYSWVKLSGLLVNARGCKATDSRDFVFSVLGLADPAIYPITPNYRDNLRAVLVTTAGVVVEQDPGLDIFAVCQNPERKHGLPSWVPNLADDWTSAPFSRNNSDLRVTNYHSSIVRVDGEILSLKGGLVDGVHLICADTVKNGNDTEELEAVYEAWQKFIQDAMSQGLLEELQAERYINESAREKTRHWLRFLSALEDAAEDLIDSARNDGIRGEKEQTTEITEWSMNTYQYESPYFKLAQSYFLPPTYTTAQKHRNRRIHNALSTNCIGRRLGVTKRGFLVLIPAEAEVGDPIAIFRGASMSYILREMESDSDCVLVGEAFVPAYTCGGGEGMANDIGDELDNWIRLS
jgi:hypothetical protein